MARHQPKSNMTNIMPRQVESGFSTHLQYQQEILKNEPIAPKPLEYEDVDAAMFDFLDKQIDLVINGKVVPTFTLYSNQRFSEYSQTWSHVDEDENLLMNFKTINRTTNPSKGTNQGNKYNIPGDRWYPIYRRDVIDDNGVECTEICSMRQPYTVDLTYRLHFVTNTLSSLNRFNEKIIKQFKALQQYIRPNGHFVPLTISDIADDTQYNIDERKFYVQRVTVLAKAYIINKEDIKITCYPKRTKIGVGEEGHKHKPVITVEEYEAHEPQKKGVDIVIDLEPYLNRVEFVADEEIQVTNIEKSNIRSVRMAINDEPVYLENGCLLKPDDNVKIVVVLLDKTQDSQIILQGFSPNEYFYNDEVPEKVSDEPDTQEIIVIE